MRKAPSRSASVRPGFVSPLRSVPKNIIRPEYVGRKSAHEGHEPLVKDAETIEKMRIAGRIAAEALDEIDKIIAPGVSHEDIDRLGHEFLLDHGAYPSTLGYLGFPKSLCTSTNEVICHGIPDDRILQDGDVVKVDITAYIHGVHGDTCRSFIAGQARPEVSSLVTRTHEAMMRGVRAAKPGRAVNVIGRVIESYAARFGYGVVSEYTGHGIGSEFHSGLVIPHYDDPYATTVLEEGMTLTIEPMLTLGSGATRLWDDGWTVVSKDLSWSAQWEHTMVITNGEPEILTLSAQELAAKS